MLIKDNRGANSDNAKNAQHNDNHVVAYIAFTPYDVEWKNPVQRIEKAWFSSGLYIPLKLNPGAAMEAALGSSQNYNVKSVARTMPTEWKILRLTLEPDHLMHAFKAGTIRCSTDTEGYEWWGDLDSNNGKCIMAWENYVLKPTMLWEVMK